MVNTLKLAVEGVSKGLCHGDYWVLVNLVDEYIELPITEEQYKQLEGGISKDTLIKLTIEISGY